MALVLAFALLQDTPADLIKRLGDDAIAVREKATEALIKLGPKVLPDVDKAKESSDPEISARARRVADEIRLRERARTALIPEIAGIKYTFKSGDSKVTLESRLDKGRVILEDTLAFVFFDKDPAAEEDLFWSVPKELKAGAKWQEPYDGGWAGTYAYTAESVKVTVPAGTYDAMRLDRHRIDRKRLGPEAHYVFLAAGIGPVKIVVGKDAYDLVKVEYPY